MKDHYSRIPTNDGTKTAYSHEFQEAMHSLSGAYQEARMKHLFPSQILDGGYDEINVLDVGFGLGYNILALVEEVEKNRRGLRVNVVSLEKSESVVEFMEEIRFGGVRDKYYREIIIAAKKGYHSFSRCTVSLLKGDARKTVKEITGTGFHGVFHDPFSPSKNPELWTVEFFNEIFRLLYLKGVLTTYSSAPQIRGALLEAGFSLGRGPSVGGKREGTLASKSGVITQLPVDEINRLRENVKSTPYRDSSGTSTRDEILERRLKEMAEKRAKGYRPARQE